MIWWGCSQVAYGFWAHAGEASVYSVRASALFTLHARFSVHSNRLLIPNPNCAEWRVAGLSLTRLNNRKTNLRGMWPTLDRLAHNCQLSINARFHRTAVHIAGEVDKIMNLLPRD